MKQEHYPHDQRALDAFFCLKHNLNPTRTHLAGTYPKAAKQAFFRLELKVPNAQTRAAMEEARALAKARTIRFNAADALIDDLENASFGASQKARQQ